MPMMQERADFVVGVDTHNLSHTASVVSLNGAELATKTVPADAFGYRRILHSRRSMRQDVGCGRSKERAAIVAASRRTY